MKYDLYIFDMDGTILNTLEDLTDSVNYALKRAGFPVHSIENVRRFVGNGIKKLIERAVPNGATPEQIEAVYKDFREFYTIHCADKTKPYDGILELLQTLHENGCKTAVVSNKADFAVQELCKQYFDELFDYAIGEKKELNKKPAPDAVNLILQELQVDKSRAVYIGDSEVDLATARNAKLPCIAVNWGFRDEELLIENGANIIVSNPDEIMNF